MTQEQINDFFESIKYELSQAEKFTPNFCDVFNNAESIYDREGLILKNKISINRIKEFLDEVKEKGAVQILSKKVNEAELSFYKGEYKHCLKELAQCGSVILRMMDFVSGRIQND